MALSPVGKVLITKGLAAGKTLQTANGVEPLCGVIGIEHPNKTRDCGEVLPRPGLFGGAQPGLRVGFLKANQRR